MSTHKHINKICAVAIIFSLFITFIFINATAFGIERADKVMGYENRLFDKSKVHTIDIVMDDWEGFIDTCENEEYAVCSVVIDGEAYKNVGIRAKGNTSLSSVSSMGSDRYSFKVEFDQYDNTKSYYGLDKLSLNNVIQDNTFMKDYLAYTLMDSFSVDAPLCSYVYITVNGEDWGLYLAVEGIEDAFLQRNYGNDYGELYKPDSMGFGGGRGNGKDFNFDDLESSFGDQNTENENAPVDDGVFQNGNFPGGGRMPQNGNMSGGGRFQENENFQAGGKFQGNGNFPADWGGMGSSDVKLQYIDDNPDSYSNIFDNAKTDITQKDKERLIKTLKNLSENNDMEATVDIDEVIRYFVVHNFLCNGDSYTGSMIHNYYLYEEDGQLSMIPWDYNLAYGTFQGSNATEMVNSPIDTPVSGGMEDRPMISWIFENEEYVSEYHELLNEFISETDFAELITKTAKLISPYVEKDPGKFCTYDEFEKGVEAILSFCNLRAESVAGQLEGSIPATAEGQTADSTALVDASALTLSDMGTMGMGRGVDNRDNSSQGMPPSQEFGGGMFGGKMPGGEMPGGEMPGDRTSQTELRKDKLVSVDSTETDTDTDGYILLGIMGVILTGGLTIAIKYKRRA